jgi:hypothetical protein
MLARQASIRLKRDRRVTMEHGQGAFEDAPPFGAFNQKATFAPHMKLMPTALAPVDAPAVE